MSDYDYYLAHQPNSGSGICDGRSETACAECGHEPDVRGFCPCDPVAVVCCVCDDVIKEGYGLESSSVLLSHGYCAECLEKELAKL